MRAFDLALYLPLVKVLACEVEPGDIALSSHDTAFLVASLVEVGERVTLLDPLQNGESYQAEALVSIVRRECLAGTAEERVAHAYGKGWLPHLARKGAK